MKKTILDQWYAAGFISVDSYEKNKAALHENVISVYWDIKIILYFGVSLLTAGLGVLIYKNIDTIGHKVILLMIALVCTGCFYYCFKTKLPFSTHKVYPPNSFFDYLLLLACCTFITFVAYLQFQYNVFGTRYGLATFFPLVVLFFTAYYFDHLGILSMAIINLAAWLGFTVTPLRILSSNDFNSSSLIFTGLGLGFVLILFAWLSVHRQFKSHFEFTYANFGTHTMLLSCLAAMFHFNHIYLLWLLVLAAMVYFFYYKALKDKSFYFMLVITCYSYIGLSYTVLKLLGKLGSDGIGVVYLGFIYFILSGLGLVLFLMRINKKLKTL